MQNNISRNEQHRNIFKLWFFFCDALAGRFSGKPQLAQQPAYRRTVKGKFSEFFNGSSRNKAEIFAFFRPRRDFEFSSFHFWEDVNFAQWFQETVGFFFFIFLSTENWIITNCCQIAKQRCDLNASAVQFQT